MSWIARAVEERLARAAADGELEPAPALKGRPIADLDESRPAGWWADRFVARERSHDRRVEAERMASSARAGFWRCTDVESVITAVSEANAAIDAANLNLVAADRLERFDPGDIVGRWRRLQPS